MIVIHHLGMSQSDRAVWLCEELGIAYDLVRYERDPESGLAPENYRDLHPAGTSPVVTDGDLVMAESGAIIEYLAQVHGGGRLIVKPHQDNFADYLFWYHFANGSMMPATMMPLIVKMAGAKDDALLWLTERLNRNYAMINDRLGRVPWLAGDEFTAADIMLAFPLTTMRLFSPIDLSAYAHIRAYLARLVERPAFKMAMQKADPGLAVPGA